MRRLLVLAGTGEARELCARLQGRVDVLASLAGAVRQPMAQGVPTRVGGFGGAEGFLRVLREERIGAVVDATHPFALRITARSAMLCAQAGVPYLRLERPGWREGPGERWTWVEDAAGAAAVVPRDRAVFLAAGRGAVAAFRGHPAPVWCRVIDPPAEPFALPEGGWVVGRPPFAVEEEMALFARLAVGALVVKDSGAEGAEAKLRAAGRMGIEVVVIRRPDVGVASVATVEEVLAWVEGLFA